MFFLDLCYFLHCEYMLKTLKIGAIYIQLCGKENEMFYMKHLNINYYLAILKNLNHKTSLEFLNFFVYYIISYFLMNFEGFGENLQCK